MFSGASSDPATAFLDLILISFATTAIPRLKCESLMIFTGVNCKTPNCDNTIALQEVSYAPSKAVWTNPNVKEFSVRCDHCHDVHTYCSDDIKLFES